LNHLLVDIYHNFGVQDNMKKFKGLKKK